MQKDLHPLYNNKSQMKIEYKSNKPDPNFTSFEDLDVGDFFVLWPCDEEEVKSLRLFHIKTSENNYLCAIAEELHSCCSASIGDLQMLVTKLDVTVTINL